MEHRNVIMKARKKYYCEVDNCNNQVVQGGVCIKHGARVKRCTVESCSNRVVQGCVCRRHGAKVRQCKVGGCSNKAVQGYRCQKHGAKVKYCMAGGCTNLVKQGGLCTRHGAKRKKCYIDGCEKVAKKGGVCMRHARAVADKTKQRKDTIPAFHMIARSIALSSHAADIGTLSFSRNIKREVCRHHDVATGKLNSPTEALLVKESATEEERPLDIPSYSNPSEASQHDVADSNIDSTNQAKNIMVEEEPSGDSVRNVASRAIADDHLSLSITRTVLEENATQEVPPPEIQCVNALLVCKPVQVPTTENLNIPSECNCTAHQEFNGPLVGRAVRTIVYPSRQEDRKLHFEAPPLTIKNTTAEEETTGDLIRNVDRRPIADDNLNSSIRRILLEETAAKKVPLAELLNGHSPLGYKPNPVPTTKTFKFASGNNSAYQDFNRPLLGFPSWPITCPPRQVDRTLNLLNVSKSVVDCAKEIRIRSKGRKPYLSSNHVAAIAQRFTSAEQKGKIFIDYANQIRISKGMKPLLYSDHLASTAQRYFSTDDTKREERKSLYLARKKRLFGE